MMYIAIVKIIKITVYSSQLDQVLSILLTMF